MKIYLSLLLCFLMSNYLAQSITQTVRGRVIDVFTEAPIPGVHVDLIKNDSVVERTVTNTEGEFRFTKVELGIYNLSFSHLSYVSYLASDVEVLSKRETVVNVKLTYNSHLLEEAVIVAPGRERGESNNRMASVSAYSLSPQDARRLAGALDDPIRASGTLPGVTSSSAFSENFISIRGNSPRGLKYIMNGAEIPNPTHFARIGSSGGTFTIFSMQMLDNSDFFTGAFPAEYGDALAGIFDVKFRNGNNEKNEYVFQIGTLGIDFSAEGPINKFKRSSFLFNYRYATIGTARLIGYPTEPTYQDLSFNLSFPLKKGGMINVFSIAGTSDRKKIAEKDSSLWERGLDRHNLELHSDMVTIGTNYKRLLGERTVINTLVMLGGTRQIDNDIYLDNNYAEVTRNWNEYTSVPVSVSSFFKHRFGEKHSNKTGFSVNATQHNWRVEKYNFNVSKVDTLVLGKGSSLKTQAYTQSKFNVGKKWVFNGGVHFIHYDVTQKQSIEPRIGAVFNINDKNILSVAYGHHSQIENYAVYRLEKRDSSGNVYYPNAQLDFAKAKHYVLSYKTKVIPNHNLRIECYYQYLNNIPVENNSSFSTVNLGELNDVRALVNMGEAINKGIDFGFERYREDGLYYMINGSVFSSQYKAGDGIWRRTEYDYGYNVRFLAGKDYIVGERKNRKNYLGWNTNVALVGGQPYTPINITQSQLQHETVLDEPRAFSLVDDDLFFVDVTFTYKINKTKHTSIWTLQIKNIFANGNALYREYDVVLNQVVTVPSSSFFPNLSYKVRF